MSAQPKLNIASIIGIKDGIHQVFALIDQNLDVYRQHPGNDKFIRDCRNYIHQLDGLLEMLNLNSVAIVTEKMKQVADALIVKQIQPNDEIIDALQQSGKALLFYLNEIVDGAEENPLRLYPAYRMLMQAYGFDHAPESDLFFPRLTAEPELKAEVTPIDASVVQATAKQLGVAFQTGLLKWLRDPSQPAGLQQMAAAVNQIETFPGTTEQRAFWWVAAGFLEDLLQQDSERIDVNARRLCGKIEQAIRRVAAGTPDQTAVLMRELLYCIAQSESNGARIAAIKRSYTWPGQDKNALTFEQAQALNPVLEKLRGILMQVNDIWREYCAGQEDSLASLSEYVDWLGMQAEQTGCAPLIKLIDVIGNTVAGLQSNPHGMSEEMAMEMATALLLVENIIDDFNKLSPELSRQIDKLESRLRSVADKDAVIGELPPAPSFDVIESKTQEKELLHQVCQEILANLAQIENVLDQFFFTPAQRAELAGLPELFKQISGALIMLAQEQANTLLMHCQSLVEKLSLPDYEIAEAEQILLVDGLSSLGFFVEAYRSGRPDSQKIIDEALALFEVAVPPQPAAVIAANDDVIEETVTAQATPVDVVATAQIDAELLRIFLEEAGEVLSGIEADLHRCRANAGDREALSGLRRGFHTLKGSGRMVKLETISEAAWYLEQVLTLWLGRKNPVTVPLLDLVAYAHRIYCAWCEDLRRTGVADAGAEAQELAQAAKALLASQSAAAKPQTEARVQTAAAAAHEAIKPAPPNKVDVPAPSVAKAVEVRDTVNPELLHIFLEETHEIVPQIGGRLRGWRILPQDEDIQRAILRLLHTLKGSARMAGAMRLGNLIHAMESHVESAFREHAISDAALDQLESEFDAISGAIEQLQQQLPTPVPTADDAVVAVQAVPENGDAISAKTILRINSELIDRLVNDSGEASMLRAKIEAQLNSFKQSLQDLSESTHRLHDQLREVEIQAETHMQSHLAQQSESEHAFDPLEFDRFTRFQELTRLMAESIDDIITVQKNLRGSQVAAEEAAAQQAIVNRQLQQSLLQIRTVPFSNFAERYYRIARQAAEDMGKKAHLCIEGENVEIDRNVLEKINPPLEHILRNAIAHGIETPAQRLQAGKAETGQVTLQLRREGGEVIITLCDDGRGLNLSRIREEAQRMGLIRQDATPDDDRILSLIFAPGLSTSEAVTGIAGRGIGLDIVKNEIELLGGRISVQTTPNQGTVFTIYLPLTLSVAQAVMVGNGKQVYAIPAFIVEHRQTFDADTLQKMYRHHRVEFNGKKYLFSHLSHLLGDPVSAAGAAAHGTVLFLHSGTQHLAVHVDEVRGEAEIAIKNAGPQLMQAPGVEGATITGEGDVILILNPVKLLQRDDVRKVFDTPVAKLAAAARKKALKTPVVMVVDDSLTVRKVTCRLLEREGCEILIAKNGKEAVEILHETTPDVMLIDLEMPKMNGFELIRHVRATPATAKMPVIVISSRTAEKHRKIAKDLGVDVFLGKPYKEDELLSHLARLGLG